MLMWLADRYRIESEFATAAYYIKFYQNRQFRGMNIWIEIMSMPSTGVWPMQRTDQVLQVAETLAEEVLF